MMMMMVCIILTHSENDEERSAEIWVWNIKEMPVAYTQCADKILDS